MVKKVMVSIRSLKTKLLIYVIIVSSVLTMTIALITLFIKYHSEVEQLKIRVHRLENSVHKGIVSSLWQFDQNQTKIILKGMLTIPEIISVKISNSSNNVMFEDNKENFDQKYFYIYKTELKFKDSNFSKEIGVLQITATKSLILKNIMANIIHLLIIQGATTFILSFILLYIFTKTVTRILFISQNISKN
jgi:hypothetical protein